MPPISADYSRESAGLFQANPRVSRFPGMVGAPCTPECQWSYIDRTEGGTLRRVYQHSVTVDSKEYIDKTGVPFHALNSETAQQAMQELSERHHASIRKQEYLRDAADIGWDGTEEPEQVARPAPPVRRRRTSA